MNTFHYGADHLTVADAIQISRHARSGMLNSDSKDKIFGYVKASNNEITEFKNVEIDKPLYTIIQQRLNLAK